MKNLIKVLGFLSLFLLFIPYLYSQEIGDGELMIVNNTGNRILGIDVYPTNAIFSGGGQYTVDARFAIDPINDNKYLYPKERQFINYEQNNNFIKANFDYTPERLNCAFSLGYGKYQINFNESQGGNSIWVDFSDANFKGSSVSGYLQKLKIVYNAWNDIKLQYLGEGTWEVNIVNEIPDKIVKVWMQDGTPYYSTLTQNKGNFNDTATYRDFPINAYDHGAINHFAPHQVFLNLKIKYDGAYIRNNNYFNINSCDLAINNDENDIIFTVNPNSNSYNPVVISGEGGRLVSGSHATLIFSEGQRLDIINKAKIISNGTKFKTISGCWQGIYLNKPAPSSINNCQFNNAISSIYSLNNLDNDLTIYNNYFYVNFPGVVCSGIHMEYANNIQILNNHFYLHETPEQGGSIAIYILNGAFSEENNNLVDGYNINILGNDFHNGDYHIWITGLAGQDMPIYIKDNDFENGGENIILKYTTGTISNNTIATSNHPDYFGSIVLSYSSPDFYNNYISSLWDNIKSFNKSYPSFAPAIIDNQLLWTSGNNTLYSSENNNIYAPNENPGYINIDHGNNNFMKQFNIKYHIEGYLDTDLDYFLGGGNCWYLSEGPVSPIYSLKKSNEDPITLIQNPPPVTCDIWDYPIIDRIITDRGYGIYDTILITQTNNTPQPNNDIILYGNGVKNQKLKNYSSAIIKFKYLINNYPNSKYLEKTIFNLYECYVSSDTNHNQGWRNVIFGDMKSFLESKIQQYDSNETFVSVAFDFLLKCKIKIKNYQPAMDGYAFIAENSPSATERLMASINYIDVEGLLQGGSGGQNNNEDYIDELSTDVNGKPIKDILLASYNKTRESNTRRENLDLQNSNDVNRTKTEHDKKHKQEKVLENRALENINISSSLTKEERRERIQKDLMLLTSRGDNTEKIIKKNNIEPIKYELSQNYPNPFNPITNIKYQIQKTGLVTMKIYDITGREIKTLVNEIKNPGSYIVTFNGTELASGVYFYRIQSGEFVQVKKMVLLK